jgi:tetratricopeptide (TPR) repeat protein
MHMEIPDTSALDMKMELFLEPFKPVMVLPKLAGESVLLQVLKSDAAPEPKRDAMVKLAWLTRAKRAAAGGKFAREDAVKFICQLETQRGTPAEDKAAYALLLEGAECENYGDFEGALLLYEAAAGLDISDHKRRYYSYNNTGFCLNYLKRFAEALDWLQKALDHEPGAYNAWKNAGVALEHLGQPADAAAAYINAINKSRGETRSVKHFLRLLERHPGLAKVEDIQKYVAYLRGQKA